MKTTRNNIFYQYKGVWKCIKRWALEWSKETGIAAPTLIGRMEDGWPEECILNPVRKTGDKGDFEVADDYEAWKDCDERQLKIMREFEKIGRTAKC
jgi:hypothetical protein